MPVRWPSDRFSWYFAVKRGRRYHYYVSQAVLQQCEGERWGSLPYPAREIESLIGARLYTFLGDPVGVGPHLTS